METENGNDNLDGWVDEVETLTFEEQVELKKHVKPLRTILVRVRESSQKGDLVLTITYTDVQAVIQDHQLYH